MSHYRSLPAWELPSLPLNALYIRCNNVILARYQPGIDAPSKAETNSRVWLWSCHMDNVLDYKSLHPRVQGGLLTRDDLALVDIIAASTPCVFSTFTTLQPQPEFDLDPKININLAQSICASVDTQPVNRHFTRNCRLLCAPILSLLSCTLDQSAHPQLTTAKCTRASK